ncbi:AlpA family transcriptional regulator [Paraburkholderia sp. BL6665CI2N2]|uniref:helix-turn-helix transcriptional regulator n=1 Tax=Paraburkholderia sp. BL6665CI2N2 TaxID=1938806 RepID=UPI001064DD23|nr:hypothetical protein [Paraburkholderia sp. BL6665CI2N2]TDY23596.1 AlpA family transcriptional regulator [Paraburkholderia sp. BL6665CI2N2]
MIDLNPKTPDVIVLVRQVAKEIGLTPATVRRRSRAGKLPRLIQICDRGSGVWRSELEKWKADPLAYVQTSKAANASPADDGTTD